MGVISSEKSGLSFVDALFLSLSILLMFSSGPAFQSVNCHAIVKLEPFLMAYCILRICFSVSYAWTTRLLIIALAVFCTYELLLGYTQLFGNWGSIKGQESVVASFSGSGPFGCFLSICSSLFVAVYSKDKKPYVRIPSLVLVILCLILMACTLSRAAMISFAASILFLAMKREHAASMIRKCRIYLLLIVTLMGAGAYMIKKPSADGRILMARVGLRVMKDNGLKGVGLGKYSGEYGKAQADFFSHYGGENLRMVADSPAFGFNEYLRIGIEAGALSMLLFTGMVIMGTLSAYRKNSIWCYPLVSISLFACFSYPFEVGALTLLMMVFLASASCGSGRHVTGYVFHFLLFIAFGYVYYSRYSSVNTGFSGSGLSLIERFCGNRHKQYYVHDYSVLQDGLYDEKLLFLIGQSLNRSAEYEKSDSVLSLGTEISSDPMFWNVMGNNSLAQGRYRQAESRYRHAFMMVPNRLYPLYLLARLYHEEGDTARFLEMADRVETFIPKVESVNTERLRSEIRELRREFYGQTNR